MPHASRAIPILALISVLASCSAGHENSSTLAPTGTTTTYTGAFANSTRSGTIAVAITSGATPALLALPTGINAQLKRLDEIMHRDLPAFNKLVRDQNIPAIIGSN